jgi:hypothetical protein
LSKLPARREREVDTRFGRTHVVSVGRDAPALVLLHGSGGCAAMLAHYAAWFAAREFTVHVPDVPGHLGKSEARDVPLAVFAFIRAWLTRERDWRRHCGFAFAAPGAAPDPWTVRWMSLSMQHTRSGPPTLPVIGADELKRVQTPFLVVRASTIWRSLPAP